MPIPDDEDEEAKKGKKQVLVSEEEPGKMSKKFEATHDVGCDREEG